MLEHIKFHKGLLDSGRWFELTIYDQLANIGSEVGRSLIYKESGDQNRFDESIKRAYELLDLTIADLRWRKTPKLKEITYLKELISDYFFDKNTYNSSKQFFEKYFFIFSVISNNERKNKRLAKSK